MKEVFVEPDRDWRRSDGPVPTSRLVFRTPLGGGNWYQTVERLTLEELAAARDAISAYLAGGPRGEEGSS